MPLSPEQRSQRSKASTCANSRWSREDLGDAMQRTFAKAAIAATWEIR